MIPAFLAGLDLKGETILVVVVLFLLFFFFPQPFELQVRHLFDFSLMRFKQNKRQSITVRFVAIAIMCFNS